MSRSTFNAILNRVSGVSCKKEISLDKGRYLLRNSWSHTSYEYKQVFSLLSISGMVSSTVCRKCRSLSSFAMEPYFLFAHPIICSRLQCACVPHSFHELTLYSSICLWFRAQAYIRPLKNTYQIVKSRRHKKTTQLQFSFSFPRS